MGFYYNQPQQPGFYYNQQQQPQQQQGFYYQQQQQQQPGFYYQQQQQQQQQPGFYYQQQQQQKPKQEQGFYYDGFYYDGFYYNQQEGFYYDGFYYETEQQEDQEDGSGFYYDQTDKFSKKNKDYWYKGAGKKRMVTALNGLRTQVDSHVTKNNHAPNETQGRALSNVVTVQVVREVIKKFVKNVDPKGFYDNGGDAKKLATLLAKECQSCLGPERDFRSAWREKDSKYAKAMNKVTNDLVPFMVSWQSKQKFHTPNAVQDAACMKVVAERLVDEAFYEYATKSDPAKLSNKKEKQEKQIIFIAKQLADGALGRVEKDLKKKQ